MPFSYLRDPTYSIHIWDVDEDGSLYKGLVRAGSDVEGEFGAGLYAVWTENDKGVLSYMYLAFKESTSARILIDSGGRILRVAI